MDTIELARMRAIAALKTLFIADSLAMPVHWYYNPMDIFRDFRGGITGFEAAPARHPGSIMSLHSTRQGGRSAAGSEQTKEIVGDVILKGRRQFWEQPNVHYHHGMQAGENTLNAHCARVMMRILSDNAGRYDQSSFLEAYIELLTADPAQHPDTYAESYHRGFFANLETGKPAHLCGAVTHDTASIGGLVTIAPMVFSERLQGTDLSDVQDLCVAHLYLTHPDQLLAKICRNYVALLDALLFRKDEDAATLISAWSKRSIGLQLSEIMGKIHSDNDVVGSLFSSACYIADAWPSVLYLAYKYTASIEAGLLSNTNLGGDNVHRGAILGVLLGLCGAKTVPLLFSQLKDSEGLEKEITALICR
ncbi:MAG: ADP-ribosylglycohydrolase family protein [Gammaproteobacteria bacterium]|nr:ADP-ribosylglycohydrolase family protein [Gammaproteobacteria bacterium]